MIKEIDFSIDELKSMKKYPNKLFYMGNIKLLEKKKISVVGTRRPNSYTKEFTHKLVQSVICKNKLKYARINLNKEGDV